MARATTCDTCGKERPQKSDGWAGWLEVEPHDLDSYGGGRRDFCSLACLASWVAEAKS